MGTKHGRYPAHHPSLRWPEDTGDHSEPSDQYEHQWQKHSDSGWPYTLTKYGPPEVVGGGEDGATLRYSRGVALHVFWPRSGLYLEAGAPLDDTTSTGSCRSLAIPDGLADIPSVVMTNASLLSTLNSVLGTEYQLDMPGLRDCLKYVLARTRDFGQAYGLLRPWWPDPTLDTGQYFATVRRKMQDRKKELRKLRNNAIQGSCITDSRLPPRRIWDLFSNRVLHLHALPRSPGKPIGYIPPEVWCISHGWVDEKSRIEVITKVNGEEWRVPIPRATSLAHVRVELLNMGAQYVWLDILCLRQVNNKPEWHMAEERRREEWKTDLPTIGCIYQRQTVAEEERAGYSSGASRGSHIYKDVKEAPQIIDEVPCVTYFNGLGLPFDISSATLNSDRHWCHRVWTVQETCDSWLPGGMTGDLVVGMPEFFAEVHGIVASTTNEREVMRVIADPHARRCGKEHDRINGLAHLLGCDTLPFYVDYVHEEMAWSTMIKHLPPRIRTEIFIQYAVDEPFALHVSWRQFLKTSPKFLSVDLVSGAVMLAEEHRKYRESRELVHLLDRSALYKMDPAEYWQVGRAIGPCRASRTACNRASENAKLKHIDIYLHNKHSSHREVLKFAGMQGVLMPDVDYTLLGFYSKWYDEWRKWWVAVEVVGERNIADQPVLEGLKWAVLLMDEKEAMRISSMPIRRRSRRVIYVTGQRAIDKSRRGHDYLKVFHEGVQSGEGAMG
ncbi:uncharacterized protein PHACADRAFT_209466 [Phanerochaete carnosa HHB-10118-sp]|uniref:Heterokaryon incompatibility domain-containing protein n=1 Tax=Phanerochaete carnosa (strain HHB-10118-sp) TaxID=650164 RepID=K5W9S7_PHACS|nr:uncharacterized protein PHACADRAFT_209466 [Phanerochaete carnosa HHB-10118-sp]EKM55960.1 hypothetical protein PHACADRAFT_209466 [Phanerochaete carnosa HHB-10118-sp]